MISVVTVLAQFLESAFDGSCSHCCPRRLARSGTIVANAVVHISATMASASRLRLDKSENVVAEIASEEAVLPWLIIRMLWHQRKAYHRDLGA